jgi:hypothetical protein
MQGLYKFEMGGIPSMFEADNHKKAVSAANNFYRDLIGRGEVESSQGVWMKIGAGPVQSYRWVVGNFFD